MTELIQRELLLKRIQAAFAISRIVCLLGPRQCGKTTLARQLWQIHGKTRNDLGYFDLERPADVRALENPELVLPTLNGLIIIDEIQRKADLFPYLRYLHDEQLDQQFLLLGSASRDLVNHSSETLAGRIAFIEIPPFSITELTDINSLWLKGGFPRSYLLDDDDDSILWRENYMRSYVEQDLRQLLNVEFSTDILQRLWFMLAHYHGQIINYAALATTLEISQPTIKKYIGFLSSCFMLRLLKPWHTNLKKRQVKSAKVYYRDSGLLHYVLGINHYIDILKHPYAGASFEGFAMEQVIRTYNFHPDSCYFWRSYNNAELDLFVLDHGKRLGFEFKLADAPKLSKAMQISYEELELDSLSVIYPGTRHYQLSDKIGVIPLTAVKDVSK